MSGHSKQSTMENGKRTKRLSLSLKKLSNPNLGDKHVNKQWGSCEPRGMKVSAGR